ncbi:hypothetical protein [Demequina pelophila]|uniref:hypothetical protein n=1 Tax=Demequina pelophila TaxID=1638984 RepID=UPI000783A4D0|nr:hypothetical protein [Demequina pelophila]
MTMDVFPDLSLAEAARELAAHLEGRPGPRRDGTLMRVSDALSRLEDPHLDLDIIHIAGLDGRASTARMTEAILRRHGLRTALLAPARRGAEALFVDGAELGPAALVAAWRRAAPALHHVDARAGEAGRATHEEALLVLGLVAARAAEVDVVVLEAAGTDRDATHAADARVAVLADVAPAGAGTGASRDAAAGTPATLTPAQAARAAAGIIKPGAAVVCGPQRPAAATVIAQAVAARGAVLAVDGQRLSVTDRREVEQGQVATLTTVARTYRDVFVPGTGEREAHHALLALAACEAYVGAGIPRALHLPSVAHGLAAAPA